MNPKAHGHCRVKGKDGQPDQVRCFAGDLPDSFEIDETTYRFRCYKPPIEDLHWCSDSTS